MYTRFTLESDCSEPVSGANSGKSGVWWHSGLFGCNSYQFHPHIWRSDLSAMSCTNSEIAIKTQHDLAIGEILDQASDLHKSVISAYRCEVEHKHNIATLSSSKFNAQTLSTCAAYLGIKVVDAQDKPIFSSKKEVADRIIMKIESYFATLCRECDAPYHNHFQAASPPLLVCHSCYQGSHDCEAMKEKTEALVRLDLVIGSVWLCHECISCNDAAKTYCLKAKAKGSKSKPKPEAVQEHLPTDSVTTEESKGVEQPPPPRVPPNQMTDVCTKYRHGNCPHGRSGNRMVNGSNCGKPHPRECFRYRKYGTDEHRGCTQGRECKWFHPVICSTSLKKQRCTKEVCSHVHLLTARKAKKGNPGRYPEPSASQRRNGPKAGNSATARVKKDTKLTLLKEKDFLQALLSQQEQFMREMKDLRELVTQTRYQSPFTHPNEWPGVQMPATQPPPAASQSQPQYPVQIPPAQGWMESMKIYPRSSY